jgi:hypothetical protein
MRWRAVAIALVVATAPAVGRADTIDECMRSAEAGQELRGEGKLLEARRDFSACMLPACPVAVRVECGRWHAETEGRIPSAVVRARRADGRDVVGARATIDGAQEIDLADGRAVELDPGRHRVVARAADLEASAEIVLREGEKGRVVDVVFPAPKGAASEPAPRPKWPAYAAFGTAGAALVTAGIFGVVGFGQWQDLQDCKPRCAQDDVDAARAKFIVSDVAVGIGLVAAAVGLWYVLSAPPPPVTTVAATRGP